MRDVLENRVAELEIDSFDTNISHFWLSLTEFYRWKAKNNIPQTLVSNLASVMQKQVLIFLSLCNKSYKFSGLG